MNLPVCSDLATKAELQELRDQINALLGVKEDGSVIDVLSSGDLPVETVLGDTITNAMRDIELVDENDVTYNAASFNPLGVGGTPVIVPNFMPEPEPQVRTDLKKGKAKWMKILLKGQKAPINSMTRVSQDGAKRIAANGAIAGGTANTQRSMKGTLLELAMEIVGLGMAVKNSTDIIELEAWQKANEKAIDLYEQENGNLQNLLNKYGKDLTAAEQSIDNLESQVGQVTQDNNLLKQDIISHQQSIDILKDNLDESLQNQQQLKADLQATKVNLEQYKEDANEAITALQTDIGELEQSLTISEENIERIQESNYKQENKIGRLQANQIELQDRFFIFTVYQSIVRAELNELIVDLQEENDLQTAKSQRLAARLTILEANGTKKGGGGGGMGFTGASAIADTQNKTLSLMER
jgi:DNA repair exonuclease SbcCD ATPase subunit